VVVSIIAVLAALLLPVLGRVRVQALRAPDASNLRQIHMAYSLYAGDNDAWLPRNDMSSYGTHPAPDVVNMYWLEEGLRRKLTGDYGLEARVMSCPAVDTSPSALYGNALGEGSWAPGGTKVAYGVRVNATSYSIWAGRVDGHRWRTSTVGLQGDEMPLRDDELKVMKNGRTLIPWMSCYQVYSALTHTWFEPGTITDSSALHHNTGMSAVNPDGSALFKHYPGKRITDYEGNPDIVKVTKNLGGSYSFFLAY